MSKYIDDIHACEGNEEKTMVLLEKSVTKILLDIVLLSVLIFFYSGVLKSSAATISKTATISTEAAVTGVVVLRVDTAAIEVQVVRVI